MRKGPAAVIPAKAGIHPIGQYGNLSLAKHPKTAEMTRTYKEVNHNNALLFVPFMHFVRNPEARQAPVPEPPVASLRSLREIPDESVPTLMDPRFRGVCRT